MERVPPLSVLDLTHVAEGATPADALHNSLDLAQHAEEWGYKPTRAATQFVGSGMYMQGLLSFTAKGSAYKGDLEILCWTNSFGGGEFGSLRGTVMSVRVDGRRDASGSPRHEVVSRAQTGVLPEGIAISPDGAFVVTTNLERSMATADETFYSSLTLLKLDVQTGALTRVGDYAFDGILPEAAAFDASSRFLAVTNVGHFDEARTGASIDIWRIATDRVDPSRIELVRTGYAVPVTRGAHSLVLVP